MEYAGYTLPEGAPEQMAIVHCVDTGASNIQVNSVAGSGKTTTSLLLAHHLRNKTFLHVTYNSKLKIELREKIETLGLRNIMEAHSFHALGVKYYNPRCFRDIGLTEVVEQDTPCTRDLPRYNVIVVDEAQDISKLYCQFLRKVILDHKARHGFRPNLVIIGDVNQCIYAFKGSDSRFLSICDEVFVFDDHKDEWTVLKLRVSYRVTGNIARFVNEVMLKEKNLIPHKAPGAPVHYFRGKVFRAVEHIGRELIRMVRDGIIVPSDIFLLAPTVNPNKNKDKQNKKTPCGTLENLLVLAGIPVYVTLLDDGVLRSDVLEGKAAIRYGMLPISIIVLYLYSYLSSLYLMKA
jgi:superfamily I DNA/RNA helicase